jgi:hypothetical protein
MIGLMYPLQSVLNVRMTRNHAAIVQGIQKFTGRKYDYTPMNDIEQQYANYPTETVERIRNKVSLSALKGLIIHMGTLKQGRKSLIVVSEGFTYMVPPQLRSPNSQIPAIGGVTGAGADSKAVSRKARGQNESGHSRDFTDSGDTIGRAVDETGPRVRDLCAAKLGQQVDGTAMGFSNRGQTRLRIEDAHPLHGRRRIEPPPRQRFMATPNAFQAARTKVAPALGEHGHELRREPHELWRHVDARAAADGQGIASVVAACGGHVRADHGIRQAMRHRRHA